MAHRIFTDSANVTWLVLAVFPYTEERRLERERRHHDVPVRVNRRNLPERRLRVRRGMERGWLVFKTDLGRRRLTPIVDGWDTCSDADLDRLCRRATPARRLSDPRSVQRVI